MSDTVKIQEEFDLLNTVRRWRAATGLKEPSDGMLLDWKTSRGMLSAKVLANKTAARAWLKWARIVLNLD